MDGRHVTSPAAYAQYRSPQIKSRDRVRELAEVYTDAREVDEMLDMVADMLPSDARPENIDRTFFEPACGSGNFLVAILRRKLPYVTFDSYGTGVELEYAVLRCLTSLYGIDINHDNVEETRARLHAVVVEHVSGERGGEGLSGDLRAAVDAVLATNVLRADTFRDTAAIELVEYRPVGGGSFVRTWSRPLVATTGSACSRPSSGETRFRSTSRDSLVSTNRCEPTRSADEPHDARTHRTPRSRHPGVPRAALERRGADAAEARERDARPASRRRLA